MNPSWSLSELFLALLVRKEHSVFPQLDGCHAHHAKHTLLGLRLGYVDPLLNQGKFVLGWLT